MNKTEKFLNKEISLKTVDLNAERLLAFWFPCLLRSAIHEKIIGRPECLYITLAKVEF